MLITPKFEWNDRKENPTATVVTSGTFNIYLNALRIWGSPDFIWPWVSVLEHLNDVFPSELEVENPNFVKDEEFYYTVDFSKHVGGAALPMLRIWLENNQGYIQTDKDLIVVSKSEVEELILSMGNQIAQRLMYSGDERSRTALEEWSYHIN